MWFFEKSSFTRETFASECDETPFCDLSTQVVGVQVVNYDTLYIYSA